MSLLSVNDFVGKYAIGQFQLNEKLLKWYIDNEESLFFAEFFTPLTYYSDLSTRLESVDVDIKTVAEAEFEKIKTPLIAWVWLQYTTNEQERLTGSGITLEQENNAKNVNMDIKCLRVWNDMIKYLKVYENEIINIIKTKLRYRNFFRFMIIVYDWWINLGQVYNTRFPNEKATFYYDNIVNIGLSLNAADRTTTERINKYPAIIMLSSLKEQHRIDGSILIKPQILIVTNSKRDYLLDERQNNVYKPILYPIMNNLILLLQQYNFKDFTKYDRDRISGALRESSIDAGIANLFNDSLDGIELRDGNILIKKTC